MQLFIWLKILVQIEQTEGIWCVQRGYSRFCRPSKWRKHFPFLMTLSHFFNAPTIGISREIRSPQSGKFTPLMWLQLSPNFYQFDWCNFIQYIGGHNSMQPAIMSQQKPLPCLWRRGRMRTLNSSSKSWIGQSWLSIDIDFLFFPFCRNGFVTMLCILSANRGRHMDHVFLKASGPSNGHVWSCFKVRGIFKYYMCQRKAIKRSHVAFFGIFPI